MVEFNQQMHVLFLYVYVTVGPIAVLIAYFRGFMKSIIIYTNVFECFAY